MSFFSSLGKAFKGLGKTIVNSFSSTSGLVTGGLGTGYLNDVNDAVTGGLTDFWGDYTGKNIAEKNLKFQEKQLKEQQWLNREQMKREDNAMVRKVTDLKNAGLNPVLAANGTGAPSAPLHAGTAPQMSDYSGGVRESLGQLSSFVMNALKMKKDFAVQDATIQKLQAERGNIIADTAKKDEETKNLKIINAYEDEYLAGRNQGQKLANETKEFALTFAKTEAPLKIENMVLKNSEQEKRNALLDLQKTADQLRITGLELDNINKGLQNRKAFKELDKLDREIESLAVAIALKNAEYQEYQYARGYFHERFAGAPVGYALPDPKSLAYGIIRKAIDEVDEGIPDLIDKIPRPNVSMSYEGMREAISKNKVSPPYIPRYGSFGDYGVRGKQTR